MIHKIPELSLVVLVGASGSGKSTFARHHFKPTEILSSDAFRGMISDDENDQTVTGEAFALLHHVARIRLGAGKLTVIDATNVQRDSRLPLVALAREMHCLPVAIVLDVPEKVAHERNLARPDRSFGPHVIRNQMRQLHQSLRYLQKEGFRHIHVLRTLEEIDSAQIVREPLWNNLKHVSGPFDIIGDVHGCHAELVELLQKLGHAVSPDGWSVEPADGRRLVFLGDLVDRGPDTPGVLKLVMNAVASGAALCVPGNHDIKLMRKLQGRDVRITHGLEESLTQLSREPEEFSAAAADFIDSLVSHYVLDDGRLVVAHAGMKQSLQGRGSGVVREFALYGETTGETDEFGLPVRFDWAAQYRGPAMVVYGHTPIPEPEWLNRTLNIDTGCVFGGRLTALRYPELELVSVTARETYANPARPFLAPDTATPPRSSQQQHDDLLDLADIMGKRVVGTRLHGNVTIREENATAALEIMSRFAIDPRWLIYLPPTMSPCATSSLPGYLEHPAEAFAWFRQAGVPSVVCQEKHMGSRAVIVICQDGEAASKEFGITTGEAGVCYTRTGRRFFEDRALEKQLLEHLHAAISNAGLWQDLETSWLCLDCEIMPWSAKAQELIKQQYATVGASATATLQDSVAALHQASQRVPACADLLELTTSRQEMVQQYIESYRKYCWPVTSIADYRIAPFHLMASAGQTHTGKSHLWHLEMLGKLAGGIFLATPFRLVDLTTPESEADAVGWWESLTQTGEGMVVKPLDFTVRNHRGLLQPAIKCRGREYLRIIYGPEYSSENHLERLRPRSLSAKRSLALREFALGVEALERFVRKEPLRRVHEAVFGILALESEPVDPNL